MKSRNIISKLMLLAAIFAIVAWMGGIISDKTSSRGTGQPAPRGWQTTTITTSSPHAKIFIDGNAALDAFCAGNGTNGLNPLTAHVIHNYDVNASFTGSAIVIQNTTRYLTINTCTATGSGTAGTDAGFKLVNCTNVSFLTCTASNNRRTGFALYQCTKNIIVSGTANNNGYSGIYMDTECDENGIWSCKTSNIGTTNQDYGIFLYADCDKNQIVNNFANNNTQYGIYLDTGCDGNTIRGNKASSAGTMNQYRGIYLCHICDNNIVSGNTANDNTEYGIFLESDCNGNTITNNTAGNTGTTNQYRGIYLYSLSDNNIVSGNIANGNRGEGISLESGCDRNTITNNTASNAGTTNQMVGISLDNCHNNTVSGNFANDNTEYGIYLRSGCDRNVITNNMAGNVVTAAQKEGIFVWGDCDNNTISGNTANDNTDYGIRLRTGCDWNAVTNNTAGNAGTTKQDYGICLFDNCTNNTVSSNIASNNTVSGIYLYIICDDNTVSDNIICDNLVYGIMMNDGCNGNNFTQNTVQCNGIGISLNATSSGNVIYYNRFIFNSIGNAIDNGTSNSWDNGTVGNHWSDYDGYDADGDGIGEVWYPVSGSAHDYDRKPLANTIPRFIATAANLTYEIGTNGHLASWFVVDTTPWLLSYAVSIDGLVVSDGELNDSSANITISVNGLSLGTHLITIEVMDGYGSKSRDSVQMVVTNTAPSFITTPIDLTVEAGSTGNVVAWTFADPSVASPTYSVARDGVTIVMDATCTPGIPINVSIDGLGVGTHVFSIEVNDGHGSSCTHVVSVTVTNTAPSFTATPADLSIEVGSTGNVVAWRFSDPSVTSPNYSVSRDGITIIVDMICTPGILINISTDGLGVGTHVFSIEVNDGYGGSCPDIVSVTVTNMAPSFTATPTDLSIEAGSTGSVVTWTFVDPSAASPTYSVLRDGVVFIVDASCTSGVSITVPVDGLAAGWHVFSITVSDGFGGTCSDTVQVHVMSSEDPVLALSNAIITGLVLVAVIIAAAIIVHGLLVRKRNIPAGLHQGAGSRDAGVEHGEQEHASAPARGDADAGKPKAKDEVLAKGKDKQKKV
nr:NosD domain-containing protein [Candidatus Sigynarchaeota archaeon]